VFLCEYMWYVENHDLLKGIDTELVVILQGQFFLLIEAGFNELL
jgi:hypothetical protein